MIPRTRRNGLRTLLTRFKPGLILAPLLLAAVAFGAPRITHLTPTRQAVIPSNQGNQGATPIVFDLEEFAISGGSFIISEPRIDIPPIDPKTPIKDLLPTPPRLAKIRPLTSDDLTQVPEVQYQAPLRKDSENPTQQTAFMLAKISHLNRNETDGFLKALMAERQDLAGLPFAMGDACRSRGERSRQFAKAVDTVRQSLEDSALRTSSNDRILLGTFTFTPPGNFWTRYQTLCDKQDAGQPSVGKEVCEHVMLARIAALMQILAPESPSMRLGLVKHLSGIAHVEATHALARLAVFSAEDEVRLAAVAALQVRRERDYTDILSRGLRYPYPKVARNAADAIVRLKRTDLVPELVAMLDGPDPRAPIVQEVDSKKVAVVNEMVRINHHRNCAMCHSPGTNDVPDNTLTAGVPLPNEPLTGPSGGYRNSRQQLLVRIDVTYLRQDFSLMQPVANAKPWPEMQRFDFLVRTRPLHDDEVATYQEQFGRNDPARPSPYHKAALAALREITGRDTAPTGDAWRKLLELPARNSGKSVKDISAAEPMAQLR